MCHILYYGQDCHNAHPLKATDLAILAQKIKCFSLKPELLWVMGTCVEYFEMFPH